MHPSRLAISLTAILLCVIRLLHAQAWPVEKDEKWGIVSASGKTTVPIEFAGIVKLNSYPGAHPDEKTYTFFIISDSSGAKGLANADGRMVVKPAYHAVLNLTGQLKGLVKVEHHSGECRQKIGLYHLRLNKSVEPILEDAFVSDDTTYLIVKNVQWGVLDNELNWIIPTNFEEIKFSSAGFLVRTGEKWGMYNYEGRQILPPLYKSVELLNGTDYLLIRTDQGTGIADRLGNILIQPEWLDVKHIGYGRFAWVHTPLLGLLSPEGTARTEAKYERLIADTTGWIIYFKDYFFGLMDEEGNEITHPKYDHIPLTGKEGYAVVEKKQKKGVVIRSGEEIIPPIYNEIDFAGDSLFYVRKTNIHMWMDWNGEMVHRYTFDEKEKWSVWKIAKFRSGEKWGIINLNGEVLIPPKYRKIILVGGAAKLYSSDFDYELAWFTPDGELTNERRLVLDKENEPLIDLTVGSPEELVGWFRNSFSLWGLKDIESSEILIKPRFHFVEVIPGTGLSKVVSNDTIGIANHIEGKVTIEPLFSRLEVRDFENSGVARGIYGSNGKYTLVTRQGQDLQITNAGYIGKPSEGFLRINQGGKSGWIDKPRFDTLMAETWFDKSTNTNPIHYLICEGGKWGWIDTTGNWVMQPEYEQLKDYESGMARFKKDGKWGVMDQNRQIVLPPAWDIIHLVLEDSATRLLRVGTAVNLYGFIDNRGNEIIPPAFYQAGTFSEGMVPVQDTSGLWGFADTSGRLVIPFRYRETGGFHGGFARIKDAKGWWGFIDKAGNEITKKHFLRAYDFKEGLAAVQDGESWGYIDDKGEFVIEPEFSFSGSFTNGLAPAMRKRYFGFINKAGKWVLQPKYVRVEPPKYGVALVQDQGGYGMVDSTGNFMIKPEFNFIGDFTDGYARIRKDLGYGLVDTLGRVIVEPVFANALDFTEGCFAAYDGKAWGFADTSGNYLVDPAYQEVRPFSEHRAGVRKTDKWGFVDQKGNMVIRDQYYGVKAFHEGLSAVWPSGWGYIDSLGYIQIQPEFSWAGDFREGRALVLKDGYFGMLNPYGCWVIQPKYDDVDRDAQELVKVRQPYQYGIMNGAGQELLPANYDYIEVNDGSIIAGKPGEVTILLPDGSRVW